MIKLFHGSNQAIDCIDLSKGKPYKDFGQGFYTTHILAQAQYWSQRIADRFGGIPTVTEFEFNEEAARLAGLNIKTFERPTEEWAAFVMANRRVTGCDFSHDYDIVIGPVADDKMASIFGLYNLEILTLEDVVKRLTYKDLSSQYFFATEKSLKYLKRI